MSDSITAMEQLAAQSRRDFVKGLGAGAIGMSMLAGERLLADEPRSKSPGNVLHDWFEEDLDEEATDCDNALWAVDRNARLTDEINIVKCTPCDCPTVGHVIARTQINFQTTFSPNSFCDELGALGIGDAAVMRWALKNRFLRINGPCQTPLGVNSGTFAVLGADGTVHFRGQVRGTLGFDPCGPVGEARCCFYPRVHGMLIGAGVSDRTAGCVVRWSYCGVEGTVPCQESFWDVGITGLTRCPCPTDPAD